MPPLSVPSPRGGALTHVISGIDMAPWDVFGKITGQPVSRLPGGVQQQGVGLCIDIYMKDSDLMRERTAFYRTQDFKAIKTGRIPFGRRDSASNDAALVRAAREGWGPDCRLMVDAGASDADWRPGLKRALDTARKVAGYDVDRFQEVLRPDAVAGFRALRLRGAIPEAPGLGHAVDLDAMAGMTDNTAALALPGRKRRVPRSRAAS